MNKNQNIGEWTANVKKEGKAAQIIVNGTFPTNGEKPGYKLRKNDPQGVNQTELLLTLDFGSLATFEGTVSFSVYLTKAISNTEQYKTVLVIDDNDRIIANVHVTNP